MDLKTYDFDKGSCIDYMQGVLLGITQLLTTLEVSPKDSEETFSIVIFSELIDKKTSFDQANIIHFLRVSVAILSIGRPLNCVPGSYIIPYPF